VEPDSILSDLNDEQRRAAELVRGPVCILAGAGTGKTTTITRRIANQIATGTFSADEVLAITFTDKAAAEMRRRLARLGAGDVRARTFHSAALAQLRHLGTNPPTEILPTKVLALRQLANRLPRPYRFRPAGDLATEIEWAKNRRTTPEDYLEALGGHQPPIPAEMMQRVFADYEEGKRRRGLIDFEDMLELTIGMFDREEDAAGRFRSRYRAFTIDEFQDVNVLQFTLLERWLGGRDEWCAVGDDYQSIYGFAGASPSYLLELPRRYAGTRVVRLETNYRSSPEVLRVANRLVPRLDGARKVLRPTRPTGPEADTHGFTDEEAEAAWVKECLARSHSSGTPYEDMAILFRINSRAQDFEEALDHAGIPYMVRDGAFTARPAPRRVLSSLSRSAGKDVARRVLMAARREGWLEDPPAGLGEQETTRQNDLARLVRLAAEFDDGSRTGAEFCTNLHERFSRDGAGRAVSLLTYHSAKGLEFDDVYLPRLNDGELPHRRARDGAAIAEERRLLYVGITRCKRRLFLSWLDGGRWRPSPFLLEMGLAGLRPGSRGGRSRDWERASPVERALRAWRSERARDGGVPAYVIFNDSTLEAIAHALPRTRRELSRIPGIGPMKLDGYGDEILALLGTFSR
jgi:DNA helicase-2/ATP-dependent DNA helicase PcrA